MTPPLESVGAVLPSKPIHIWREEWRPVGKGVAVAVGLWWFFTGLILALQRNAWTRLGAWCIATALAWWSTRVIHQLRNETTPSSARRTFVAVTLIWTWVQVGLYGGWIVGPGGSAPGDVGNAATLAVYAIRSLAWHELTCVALLLALWWMVRRTQNRLAFHAMLTYWSVLQVAKLMIFLGVANPGARFLPEHLEFLLSYYGPPVNSPWLFVSVFAALGASLVVGFRGWLAPTAFLRQSRALVAVVLVLAVVEYALLGVKTDAPLWDMFLNARGY
jgi:putative photosynthetic complex assembly protein 2